MGYNFITCDVCPCKFRVKKLNKPYLGMYEDGNPVFHWHYDCPNCHKRYTVRFYNKSVNVFYDRVRSIEFSLYLNRKVEEKCEPLRKEYEIAKVELEEINNRIKNIWGL
jgi:hypothetical protein